MMKKMTLLLTYLFILVGIASAQVSQIKGTVTSTEDGLPVVGASVIIKGTTQGTITDMDGQFTISGVSTNAKTLVVSYVGMKTLELPVKAHMTIALDPDAEVIDEVIVVAYGTAKKSSFTGSASAVGSKELQKRAVTSITSGLEGQASGIQVTSASGQPGSDPEIMIRGFGSINGSSAPLYVLDGTVYNGTIADLNPNDIESMTVLKDAASTALYGSSAGNGVILITTKKAKGDNKVGVALDIKQGFSSRSMKEYERVNPYDYYRVAGAMYANATGNAATAYSTLCDKQLGGYNPFAGVANNAIFNADGTLSSSITGLKWADDMDWEDAAYRTGSRSDYNLSYTSKSDKSDAFASLGYVNEKGTQINTDYKRYSGRVNLNVYPVKWFKGGLNISASKVQSTTNNSTKDSSSGYANLTRFVRNMPSIYPIHKHYLADTTDSDGTQHSAGDYLLDSSGNMQYDYDGARKFSTGRDAIAEAQWNKPEFDRNTITANTYADFNLMDGLTVTLNGAYNSYDRRYSRYENTKVGDGATAGRMTKGSYRTTSVTFNELIKYNKTFGKHSIDLLAGHENYKYDYNYFYGMKTAETISGIYELGNFVSVATLDSYSHEYTKEGYMFRANYDYDGKYYASFSFRHDGTSVFSKDSRWGNFYSIGASWRISEEPFMKNVKWVNNLKLRASYGETGNDNLNFTDNGYNFYQTLYDLGINNKTEGGVYFKAYGAPNLQWETQVSADLGVEFGLFDNRLTGSIEYFTKKSKDLLMEVPVPTSSGTTHIYGNIGQIDNKGLEINLDYRFIDTKDWKLSAGANATFLDNKVSKLPEKNDLIINDNNIQAYAVGHSRYAFYLRQWYGVDSSNGNPLYILNETDYPLASNTNDSYTTEDGTVVTSNFNKAKYDWSGDAVPTVTGGFNINASYKNFDLGLVFSYQLGGDVYNSNYKALMANAYTNAWHTDMMNAWTQEGDVTDVPKLNSKNATNTDGISSRWLMSSDYLSFRSFTLGYSVPKALLKSIGLQSCRVSVSGENLFQWNCMQGLDCQAQFSGITYNQYVPSRTFTFGLNVAF